MRKSEIEHNNFMQLVAYSKLNKKQKEYVDANMLIPSQYKYSGFGRTTKYYKVDELNKIMSNE